MIMHDLSTFHFVNCPVVCFEGITLTKITNYAITRVDNPTNAFLLFENHLNTPHTQTKVTLNDVQLVQISLPGYRNFISANNVNISLHNVNLEDISWLSAYHVTRQDFILINKEGHPLLSQLSIRSSHLGSVSLPAKSSLMLIVDCNVVMESVTVQDILVDNVLKMDSLTVSLIEVGPGSINGDSGV
jgi:hypothetical protein